MLQTSIAVIPRAQGFDLVIHTAGPFQWKLTSSVLEAAIAAKVPYIDVADDADFSAVREPEPYAFIRSLRAHRSGPEWMRSRSGWLHEKESSIARSSASLRFVSSLL